MNTGNGVFPLPFRSLINSHPSVHPNRLPLPSDNVGWVWYYYCAFWRHQHVCRPISCASPMVDEALLPMNALACSPTQTSQTSSTATTTRLLHVHDRGPTVYNASTIECSDAQRIKIISISILPVQRQRGNERRRRTNTVYQSYCLDKQSLSH